MRVRPGMGSGSKAGRGVLVVAVDRSSDGVTVIAVVGAEEHVLKSRDFGGLGWLKHFREIPSRRKRAYFRAFPRRFSKVLRLLSLCRVLTRVDDLNKLLDEACPTLVIVDDSLYRRVWHGAKVPESKAKSRHLRTLILLADNLANYFRILLQENSKKYAEELRKIMK